MTLRELIVLGGGNLFEQAAARYFRLWTLVGGMSGPRSAQVHGLGCHIAPGLVLTAAHVYAGLGVPTVGINNSLWACSVAAEWTDRDIAVLRAERKLHSLDDENAATQYPELATSLPPVGMQLGCMAWLTLAAQNSEARGRTYFGQGHVAYFDYGENEEPLVALQGPTIEKGFSGGPVFSADGRLYGVLVQAVQHAPRLSAGVTQINSMALLSPIGKIAPDILRLIDGDEPVRELRPSR